MGKIVPQDNFLKDLSVRSELIGRALWRVEDRFNIRHLHPVTAATLIFRDEDFEDAACEAVDMGILDASQYYQMMDADMIARGKDRDTGKDAYIAVESSFTIGDSDIVRSNRTAAALRKVFPDADVRAVVYCAEISNENTQRAQDDGVEVISNARL